MKMIDKVYPNSEMERANNLIGEAKTIGIVTHKNGDGDAFSSLLALKRMLEQMGKEVVIFSSEKLITPFQFLSEKIEYNPFPEYKPVDLLIGLDANTPDRFSVAGIVESAKKSGAKVLVFDHHVAGQLAQIADVYLGDHLKSSTAEILFDYANYFKIKIDKLTATFLLLGIQMDTDSLRFTNALPETYQAFGELLKLGARVKPTVENAFGGKSLADLKLLGRVIERLIVDTNGVGISYITEGDHGELGIEAQKASGMVNFMESGSDIKVSVIFEEIGEGKIKASMRSNNSNVNVQEIAGHFGGGGHIKSAGYEFSGTLKEAIAAFKKQIKGVKDIDTKPELPVSL